MAQVGEQVSLAGITGEQPRDYTRRGFFGLAGAAALGAALPKTDVLFTPEGEARKNGLITVGNGVFWRQVAPGERIKTGFLGENWWSLGENNTQADNRICGPILSPPQDAGWVDGVRSMNGNAVRFWAFPELTDYGNNTTAVDRTINLCAERGIHVILALENHFPNCDASQQGKPEDWYRSGFRKKFLPYVKRMARKYRGNPHILAFQPVNEMQAPNPGVLRDFYYETLHTVLGEDPLRLSAPNVLGVNQPGVVGKDFKYLLTPPPGSPRPPFVTTHFYPGSEGPGTYNGLPGDKENGMYTRLKVAEDLGLPMLYTEWGRRRLGGMSLQQSANLDRSIINELLNYRAFAGLIGWTVPPSGIDPVNIDSSMDYGFNSPIAHMLRSYAGPIISMRRGRK